ncbi:MAG: hypothetical protein HC901_03995 [Bdellovibrionaceae bacterium]|nr:hypothetical protein [Pseudobdellovibrionaceae bacterium]
MAGGLEDFVEGGFEARGGVLGGEGGDEGDQDEGEEFHGIQKWKKRGMRVMAPAA